MNSEWIRQAESFLRRKYNASRYLNTHPDAKAYRLEHSYRVANIGRQIAETEGFDVTETVLACLLHDVGYCLDFQGQRDWFDHGRNGARIVRPFLTQLGLPEARVRDICYGIAIHVDDTADFAGERTLFAMTVSDADNIDRFDVYRIYETLQNEDFRRLRLSAKMTNVEDELTRLQELRRLPFATPTAKRIWQERIDFYVLYYRKLRKQLSRSSEILRVDNDKNSGT